MLALVYAVFAAGFYAAVRKFSPQIEERLEPATAPVRGEIIELFPEHDLRKAA